MYFHAARQSISIADAHAMPTKLTATVIVPISHYMMLPTDILIVKLKCSRVSYEPVRSLGSHGIIMPETQGPH